ncbi:hypothetical protein [Scytonema sp. PRP1]|uniref:hypothetical protein n=1 Tax=Scytonema sp. PRP1 TaxID=3120513 RepID=UPI002FCFF5A0
MPGDNSARPHQCNVLLVTGQDMQSPLRLGGRIGRVRGTLLGAGDIGPLRLLYYPSINHGDVAK